MGNVRGKIKRNIRTDDACRAGIKPQQFQIDKALQFRQAMINSCQPVTESEDQIKAMNLVANRLFCQRCRAILHRLRGG